MYEKRCVWCNVSLRWWQAWSCRRCTMYLRYNMPYPPVPEHSRTNDAPDKWRWRRRLQDWK